MEEPDVLSLIIEGTLISFFVILGGLESLVSFLLLDMGIVDPGHPTLKILTKLPKANAMQKLKILVFIYVVLKITKLFSITTTFFPATHLLLSRLQDVAALLVAKAILHLHCRLHYFFATMLLPVKKLPDYCEVLSFVPA